MYMSSNGANDERTQVLGAGILRMLREAKDSFNAEGRCLPQAYIIKPDGTMCHCVGAAENFDAEDFAKRLERQVAEVHGVGGRHGWLPSGTESSVYRRVPTASRRWRRR